MWICAPTTIDTFETPISPMFQALTVWRGIGDWAPRSRQGGRDYTRLLGGFYNTAVYTTDIVNRSDYFASLRYQVGRVGIFGGLMIQDYTVTPSQATFKQFEIEECRPRRRLHH